MAHTVLAISALIAASQSEEDEWADTYLSDTNISLALEMCELNAQPLSSFPTCFAYIEGRDEYTLNTNPLAIPCGNQYGDIWAPDYQLASCCSGDGRYFVMTGQIGAFDWGYETPDPDTHCLAYATGLAASICSPHQGNYIRENTLFVCQSTCDTLYSFCGDPGVNFPSGADYSDGTTLCESAWGGGFDSDIRNCVRPDGPFCRENISISVVEDNVDCLSFIRPNFDLSMATEYDYAQNQYCPTLNDGNIDSEHPCNDIISALNRETQQRRRLSSSDECGSIPMYARDSQSREIAIQHGCFSSAVMIAPMTFVFGLILVFLII